MWAALAVTQILWAGYRFGAGNQGIQVTFLRHLRDPAAMAHDPLVGTLASYPTWLFPALARLWPAGIELEAFYLVLHLATCVLLFAAVHVLARTLQAGRTGAWLALLPLAGGHLAGLAESGLYSPGFTHTFAALPLALFAVNFAFRRRWLLAGALVGLTFNMHALTAAYAGAVLAAVGLTGLRRREFTTLALGGLGAVVLASPTLVQMAASGGRGFDAHWLWLLRVRSPHHVFPSSWWAAGRPDLTRFTAMVALGAVAWTAVPPGRSLRRRLLAAALALGILLVAGAVAAEWRPVPLVLRAQLFRASGWLVLGSVIGMSRMLARSLHEVRRTPSAGRALLAAVSALAWLALAVPGAQGLTPVMLVALASAGWMTGRLHPVSAAAAGGALVVALAAERHLSVPVWPGLPPVLLAAGAVALAGAAGAWAIRQALARPWVGAALSLVLLGGLSAGVHRVAAREGQGSDDDWVDIQRATRGRTAPQDMVLVPPDRGGFRLHSERAVAGEWRDGTQQFFSPAFAAAWWRRMQLLQPGLEADDEGRIVQRGAPWAQRTDRDLAGLAEAVGARWIVAPPSDARILPMVYANPTWALYRAQLPPPPPLPEVPEDAVDAESWIAQEEFMRDVVEPAIRKHRTQRVTLRLEGPDGRTLTGVPVALRQVSTPFGFGSALDHFAEPAAPSRGFSPPVVDPRVLDRFKELFNYSIIGYSGKWDTIEPVPDRPEYHHLDAYIDWCEANDIRVEYHFVTGYPPRWLRGRPVEERRERLLAHAQALWERYADRVEHWQIVNEKHLLHESPVVFEWMRAQNPDVSLGVSDCARFFSRHPDERRRERDLLRGLDAVHWLTGSQEVRVDFFGLHGHRPFGLWADPREIYEVLDRFQEEGLRVHLSEFGIHLDRPIVGGVREGSWTEELQADYYERFFRICFSHPVVDSINLWGMGPTTWMAGAGLLDENYEPKPAFHALKRLITEEWRTNLRTRTHPRTGDLAFTGFHGTYEIEVTGPDGEALEGTFDLTPGLDRASVRLRPAAL